MKRKFWLQLALVTLALFCSVAVGVWLGMMDSDRTLVSYAQQENKRASVTNVSDTTVADFRLKKAPQNVSDLTPAPENDPVTLKNDSIEEVPLRGINSFARSFSEMDERVPTIVSSAEEPLPTEAELDDPDQYLQYEERNKTRLYRSYIKHANEKVSRLEKEIALAQGGGVSEDQLKEGQEKLRLIKEMQEQLAAVVGPME